MSKINKISLTNKSLLSKFTHGFILNILLRFKGLIYVPVVVNFISKEQLGEISYVKSISALVVGLLLLNLPDSSNRIILNEKGNDYKERILNTINSINNFSFLFGVSFVIIFCFFAKGFNLLDDRVIFIVATLLVTGLLQKLSQYVFQIYQNTKLLMFTSLITEYCSLVIVILVLWKGWYDDIFTILYVYSFFVLLSSVYLFHKLFSNFNFKKYLDIKIVKDVLKISLFLLPASYSMAVIQSSDFIIIENSVGLALLGEYSFAYSLAAFVTGLSMAITFFWYSSVVYADDENIVLLIKKVTKISLPLFLFVLLGYYILTIPVINIINKEYNTVFNIVLILVIGFFINIFCQIFQGVMYAKKKEKYILFDTIICASINVLLNIIFIPKYGLKFAAFSTSLSYILLYTFRFNFILKLLPNLKKGYTVLYFNSFLIISSLLITYFLWI